MDNLLLIPMNMKRVFENKPAYYVVNGTWSNRAYEESKKFITTSNVLDKHYTNKNPLCYNDMPKLDTTKLKDGGYLYLCSNETVNGIEFHENKLDYPKKEELGNCKIIVDMSSDFLMKKVDWDNVDIALHYVVLKIWEQQEPILLLKKRYFRCYKQ